MTYRGSSPPARRAASLAARFLRMVAWIGWGVVRFLFWGLIILSIPFARYFILLPLSLGMFGGVGAAIFFASHHEWANAGSGVLLSVVCVILFGGYSYCAEKVDPDVGAMPPPVRYRYRYERWD